MVNRQERKLISMYRTKSFNRKWIIKPRKPRVPAIIHAQLHFTFPSNFTGNIGSHYNDIAWLSSTTLKATARRMTSYKTPKPKLKLHPNLLLIHWNENRPAFQTHLFPLCQNHFMTSTQRQREEAIKMTLVFIQAVTDWHPTWRETGPVTFISSVSLISFSFSRGCSNSHGWQSGGHPHKEETQRLLNILADINHDSQNAAPVHSLIRSELGENLPLHISLSRPINLATDQRQAFIDRLTADMSRFSVRPYADSSRLFIVFTYVWQWAGSFNISTHELDWVSNNENSRWFLVMRIKKPPINELNRLLQSANDAVTAFGQLPLYVQPESQPALLAKGFTSKARHSKPKFLLKKSAIVVPNPIIDQSSSFHISIGWSLGSLSAETSSSTPPKAQLSVKNSTEFQFEVKAIKLKIGNSVTSISLLSKMETGSGIF